MSTCDFLTGLNTIVLQAAYYDVNNNPLDADATPTVEIRDARDRPVQTDLGTIRVSQGVYQCNLEVQGLPKGLYYYIFSALFSGKPDRKSSTFTLKNLI
jgi:hypothetical protein